MSARAERRLLSALPSGVGRTLAKLGARGLRVHDSMPVRDYATAVTG